MVGRGARFQRAYASVYPGKVLIYARPSTDPKAAIRDPQLHKALRQAGHSVSRHRGLEPPRAGASKESQSMSSSWMWPKPRGCKASWQPHPLTRTHCMSHFRRI